MSAKKFLLAFDLSINITATVAIILLGFLLLTRLKIRLNLINRIKWAITLLAILLRLGLTIDAYSKENFTPTTTKYYLYWILE
jgi:hypothetical protein